MLPEAVAIAPSAESVDQRGRHHVITKDLAPLFEAFVTGGDRRAVFIASGEALEEEHRARVNLRLESTRNRELLHLPPLQLRAMIWSKYSERTTMRRPLFSSPAI